VMTLPPLGPIASFEGAGTASGIIALQCHKEKLWLQILVVFVEMVLSAYFCNLIGHHRMVGINDSLHLNPIVCDG
jgi:hypothetical protein